MRASVINISIFKNRLRAWPSAALASKVSCRLVSNGEKLCLLITLTADFPCNFALTFSECKKRSRQTSLTLTLYWSIYTFSCFQNSTKSCCVNIRLIKSDSWGLLLLLFQLSKTGHRPGPQAHWLVKCHAVSSQMVRNPSGRQAVGWQGGAPWQRKVWTLLWSHFFYSRRKAFLSRLSSGLRAQDTEGSVTK